MILFLIGLVLGFALVMGYLKRKEIEIAILRRRSAAAKKRADAAIAAADRVKADKALADKQVLDARIKKLEAELAKK